MRYGQDITYTNFWWCKTTCGVDGCSTPDEATKQAVELAEMDGWTPPKWWQWWRLGDTKIQMD